MKLAFPHPKAYLPMRRNFKKGLTVRSKLITILETGPKHLNEICEATELSYSTVFYHMKLMEKHGVVSRGGRKPYEWKLTGYGQQTLY
jgi:DNA-binding IclR family transcriptional regulator